jgi:predicted enzyme related to lactoylglutathione lyase
MAKVIGVGGVFFKSKNGKKLGAWYRKHLGFDVQDWGGAVFEWEEKPAPKHDRQTIWSPFAADTKHFAPSRESFMLNLIVDDLDAVVKRLRKGKVKIDPKGIEASEFGRFAWVMDPEGRKLELWEPPLKKR